MAEKARAAVIQEASIQGLATRPVDDLVKAMGGLSKGRLSRRRAASAARVKAFLERPIDGDWPSIWIDATDVKVA